MVPGLVSTIIPVFNRPEMLREAVSYVLAQTYRPVEVIVVDDASTDATLDVARELAGEHPEIRVARQLTNAGPGPARERGREEARGEFLQYLDSDDWIDPRKFEVQIRALRGSPDCGIAYCRTYEHVIGEAPSDQASARTGKGIPLLLPYLLSGRCWQTVTPLLRTSAVECAGPWSDLRQEEDWEYDARLGAAGVRLVWCPEFLAAYRHHRGPRAGVGGWRDPEKLRVRARAHELIWQHAARYGVAEMDPHRQRFGRALFHLARQCGSAGLTEESRRLFELAGEVSGKAIRGDHRVYGIAAKLVGWHLAGRLACWADRFRPSPPVP